VLLGKIQVLGVTMVPAGSSTVDGELTPPVHGLAAQNAGFVKMMPLASITVPDTNDAPKILWIVSQKSVPGETLLASMKAVEGANCPAEL